MQDLEQQNISDPLQALKQFTSARISLGRTGNSIPLGASLAFKLAHAHARDAVFSSLDHQMLTGELDRLKIAYLEVCSQASNRHQYLQRPDLGRKLDDRSTQVVKENAGDYDVSIILADGLCTNAINTNGIKLVEALAALFTKAAMVLSPLFIASQARVALADDIGSFAGSGITVILIGERPGLSAIDSIGAYITYGPRRGLTDESRNCISNIRQEGLSISAAASRIFYMVQESRSRKLSGVHLKDNSGLIS